MKLQLIIVLALLVVLTQQAPSTDAKIVTMSGSIVPGWGDIVKDWWVAWISLNRVREHWNALQSRDEAAYAGLYTSAADQRTAKARIQTFYDGARDCLNREWLPWYDRVTYHFAMQSVSACIASKPAAPTFIVPEAEAPPTIDAIKITYTDDVAGDIKGDVAEVVPAPTPAPTTATPAVTAAPYVEPATEGPTQYETPRTDESMTTTANEDGGMATLVDSEQDQPTFDEISTDVQPVMDNGPDEHGFIVGATSDSWGPSWTEQVAPEDATAEESTNAVEEGEGDNAAYTVTTPDVPQIEPMDERPEQESTMIEQAIEQQPVAADETPGEEHVLEEMHAEEFAPIAIPEVVMDPPHMIGGPDSLPPREVLHFDEVTPNAFPFSPASPIIPPMWALDEDNSHSVDVNEWSAYLTRLHTMAQNRVGAGRDAVAVKLLKEIVSFHYSTLYSCIKKELTNWGTFEIEANAYDKFTVAIQHGCYVKFRYSLFAGAPPFEWIAKKEPVVTASAIEAWFNKRVAVAKVDLAVKQILALTPEEQDTMTNIMSCVYRVLHSAGDAPISRSAYYTAVAAVEKCASS